MLQLWLNAPEGLGTKTTPALPGEPGNRPGNETKKVSRCTCGEGLGMEWQETNVGESSLVPRLPRSGMRTLKLCRCGERGINSPAVVI